MGEWYLRPTILIIYDIRVTALTYVEEENKNSGIKQEQGKRNFVSPI